MTDGGAGPNPVTKVLRAAGDGDVARLRELIEAAPELAETIGNNPYWGGLVQPLHMAATWGQHETTEVLLAAGADPTGDNEGYGGWSPLMIAVSRGHHDLVQRLLDAGAHVGPFEAASLGDAESLAENPELARTPTPDGTTLLHVAANGAVAIALLGASAEPDPVDSYGGRPLEAALDRAARGEVGAAEVVAALLASGVSTDAATLAAMGDVEGLARQIDGERATLDEFGRAGAAPLHAAVSHGRLEVVDWLLERGADPNAPDAEGVFPLHHTARAAGRAIEIARRLLDAGADPSARDGVHDATPASWAEFQRRTALVELLEAARKERGRDVAD